MSPEELQRRHKLVEQQSDDIIARVGWVIQGVMGSDTTPPFAYTIGLSQFNLPELVLVGLSLNTGGGILNPIAQKMVLDKEAVKRGPVPSGFMLKTGDELRLEVRAIDDRTQAIDNYLIQAHNRYGSRMNIMQVVWGDDKNVLPTEPGYNLDMVQPLL